MNNQKPLTRLSSWMGFIGLLATTANSPASEALGVLPDSAEALGKVGGRLATQDDPSVLRTNPANLIELTTPEYQINLGFWNGDIDFRSATAGDSITLIDEWAYVGSAYFAYPLSEDAVFGIGLNTPFGLAYEYPLNSSLRYVTPFEAQLLTANLSPALAVRVSDSLSIGAGLDFMYSRLELRQFFPWSALTGVPATPDGILDFDADGMGFGGFAGLNWEFAPRHHFALTGKLPIKVNYNGDFVAGGLPPPLLGAGFTERSRLESEIEFPGSLGVGYAWDMTEATTISADFQYFFNSSHSSVPLSIGPNQPLLGGAEGVVLGWQDSFDVGLGIEHQLTRELKLRAGYMYSSNPYPTRTYNPSIPSNDRHVASLGLGFERGRRRIDLAYALIMMPDREIMGNVQPAYDGEYEFGWHILSLSYGIKF